MERRYRKVSTGRFLTPEELTTVLRSTTCVSSAFRLYTLVCAIRCMPSYACVSWSISWYSELTAYKIEVNIAFKRWALPTHCIGLFDLQPQILDLFRLFFTFPNPVGVWSS